MSRLRPRSFFEPEPNFLERSAARSKLGDWNVAGVYRFPVSNFGAICVKSCVSDRRYISYTFIRVYFNLYECIKHLTLVYVLL